MGVKAEVIFVFLLAASLACDARDLTTTLRSKVSAFSVLRSKTAKRFEVSVNTGDNLCSLCEVYANEALTYLQQNETRQEVISVLHETCSNVIPALRQQCFTLVDTYVPLFFLEISTIQAKDFCGIISLCNEVVSYAQEFSKNKCDVCNYAVSEIITLLKDSDNQLEILKVLLEQCKSVEKYLPKCKALVFEYVPLILTNAEQILEKEDIRGKLHACESLVSDN